MLCSHGWVASKASLRLLGLVLLIGISMMHAAAARADSTAIAYQRVGEKSPPQEEADPAVGQREQAALEFVQEHHAELDGLLAYLRENRPREYQQAINELYRASEKLNLFRKRDPERYELELKAWQLHSRIQLLTARWMMERSEAIEDELRETLEAQHDLRVQIMHIERDDAKERLNKLNQQVRRMQQNRSQIIDRQLAAILRGSQNKRQVKAETSKQSAGKKTSTKGASN